MYNHCIVVKKESKMSDVKTAQYFGMFTDAGNKEVAVIVEHARANNLTWPETYNLLCKLQTVSGYGECTDTMVREIVYDALNFKTAFYI
jgi:hypothetical protein